MKNLAPDSFRPGFGRGLTIGFAAACTVAALASLSSDGASAIWTLWPWLALLAGGCWALFWRPCVRVHEAGVDLVNVSHTVHVPWSRIVGIDTAWALTVVTADKRYRAWAAPAPGRSALRNTEAPDTHRIRDAAIGGEVRPGDLPHTDSGAAAAMVRQAWSTQRKAGKLDNEIIVDGEPSGDGATRTIHWLQLIAAAVLLLVATLGLL